MYKNDSVKPYIAAIIFSLLTGFSFLGIKICQGYGSQLEILTYRYNWAFIAMVIFWFTGIFKSNFKEKKTKGKPKKWLFVSAIAYLAFMIFQVIGVFYTTSVVGAILFAITPILAQIAASIFLHEKSTFKQNIFVVITICALLYMILADAGNINFNLVGITCLLLASISMVVSNISMRYIRQDFKPFDITIVICLLGFIIFNIATVVVGLNTGTLHLYFRNIQYPQFLIGTGYLGVFCILFTAQLISYMLSKLPALKATIFGNFATGISIVAGIVVLKEPFYVYHFICAILIVVGVIGVSIYGDNGKGNQISSK